MIFTNVQYVWEDIHKLKSVRVDLINLLKPWYGVAVVVHKVEGLTDLAIEERRALEVINKQCVYINRFLWLLYFVVVLRYEKVLHPVVIQLRKGCLVS